MDDFWEFYNQFRHTIASGSLPDDYERMLIKCREVQMSYLEEIDKLGSEMRIDASREKERYW